MTHSLTAEQPTTYTVKNVLNTMGTAKEYKASDERGATNIAKELSLDFYGVYAAMKDGKAFIYFRAGRSFRSWEAVRKSLGATPSHTGVSFQ
jgi:hypothetical protein